MTSRRLLPATAVLLVAIAAPAAAAPPWSPPAPVAGAPDTNALLAAAPGGEGLLASGVASINARGTTAFGAPIDAEGAVDAAERIGRGLSVDALALYGRDRVLVAGTRVGRRDRRPIGVAFGSQQVSFAEPLGPFRAWVAYAPAGRRFRARQRLETVAESGVGTYVDDPGVRAVIRRGGRPTVAWTGRDGEFFVTRAADLEGGRVAEPQTVSPRGDHAVLAALAEGPRGELAIAWVEGVRGSDPAPGRRPSLHAAIRPATAEAFGAPESVSVAGESVVSSNVGLAILPSSGRAVAAWRQVGDPIHTSVR